MCFMLLSSPFSYKGLWSKYNGGKPIKSWSSLSMVRDYGSTEQQQCSQSIATGESKKVPTQPTSPSLRPGKAGIKYIEKNIFCGVHFLPLKPARLSCTSDLNFLSVKSMIKLLKICNTLHKDRVTLFFLLLIAFVKTLWPILFFQFFPFKHGSYLNEISGLLSVIPNSQYLIFM